MHLADLVQLDVLVIGSGVAGLSAVVRLADAPGLRVGVLTKGELAASATAWAQGGVAAVLGGAEEDSTDVHLADTLRAGAGLCDVDAVRVLVDEGPLRVRELIALGAVFDREAGGRLALAREGGHSHARVVHAGGAATGAEVERALVAAVRRTAAALWERWFALDLLVEGGRCAGVLATDDTGVLREVHARHVVLATGGAGQMFAVTTNPLEATGDGIAMTLRAGVPVADVEFFQFHPTALALPLAPRPLLSEALRGHGALLRDRSGDRFVDELLPRDIVSRAIAERMTAEGTEHVWLDVTTIDGFEVRFPTIAATLRAAGLDPAHQWLPVAPAAHYVSGGVMTDLDGATALPGLWAAGETACTGVHGANRLASNSLLDGMVFGARLAEALLAGKDGPEPTGVLRALPIGGTVPPGAGRPDARIDSDVPARRPHAAAPSAEDAGGEAIPCIAVAQCPPPTWADSGPPPAPAGTRPAGNAVASRRARLQRAMSAGAGVVRAPEGLRAAASEVAEAAAVAASCAPGRAAGELANVAAVAWALLRAAHAREETRGAHARRDHPDTRPEWRRRLVHGDGAYVPARGTP